VEHSIDCKENYLGLEMPMCSFVSLAALLQKLPLNKSPGPDCISAEHLYGEPFAKILYLTDLAQKLLSLAEIAISACRDVVCGRDSYLCMQRYYLWQR